MQSTIRNVGCARLEERVEEILWQHILRLYILGFTAMYVPDGAIRNFH